MFHAKISPEVWKIMTDLWWWEWGCVTLVRRTFSLVQSHMFNPVKILWVHSFSSNDFLNKRKVLFLSSVINFSLGSLKPVDELFCLFFDAFGWRFSFRIPKLGQVWITAALPWTPIFPLNTPGVWCPLVCVASPACGILKYMLTSFLIKLRSQIPFHIPTKHHTPSCTTNTTTEDFHSLHRSKVSKFDGIRLYARLFKTLERPRFPPYSILSYCNGFYLRRGKQKNIFRIIFLPL